MVEVSGPQACIEATVFAIELTGALVPDLKSSTGGVQTIHEHVFPRCLQPKLLLILKRTHGGQCPEMIWWWARLAKFGLELHPEKTRLIEFARFAAQDREKRGEGKPETFTFLGFTHYCGKRRSNGAFIVWRKTAKKRMVAKLHAIKAELRLRMHAPVADVGAWLRKVVTGYYRYHAVPGNIDRLSVFGQRLRRLWWLILRRRSQRPAPWDRLIPIYTRWIPAPRVLHPYPTARFLATHPRWEPYP